MSQWQPPLVDTQSYLSQVTACSTQEGTTSFYQMGGQSSLYRVGSFSIGKLSQSHRDTCLDQDLLLRGTLGWPELGMSTPAGRSGGGGGGGWGGGEGRSGQLVNPRSSNYNSMEVFAFKHCSLLMMKKLREKTLMI